MIDKITEYYIKAAIISGLLHAGIELINPIDNKEKKIMDQCARDLISLVKWS